MAHAEMDLCCKINDKAFQLNKTLPEDCTMMCSTPDAHVLLDEEGHINNEHVSSYEDKKLVLKEDIAPVCQLECPDTGMSSKSNCTEPCNPVVGEHQGEDGPIYVMWGKPYPAPPTTTTPAASLRGAQTHQPVVWCNTDVHLDLTYQNSSEKSGLSPPLAVIITPFAIFFVLLVILLLCWALYRRRLRQNARTPTDPGANGVKFHGVPQEQDPDSSV